MHYRFLTGFAFALLASVGWAGEIAFTGWSHPQPELAAIAAPHSGQSPVTLIKKLANWHQQHATGIEAELPPALNQLSLTLTVDWAHSHKPELNQITQAYGEHFSQAQLARFGRSPYYLKLSLYQPAPTGEYRRDAWLELAPPQEHYRWQLNTNTLDCVIEYQYQDLPAPHCPQTGWRKLLLVQEIAGGGVLRNLKPALFEAHALPELYRALRLSQVSLSAQ